MTHYLAWCHFGGKLLSCSVLEPDKLVHHILSDLHATKKKKSRVILRMLPVRNEITPVNLTLPCAVCSLTRAVKISTSEAFVLSPSFDSCFDLLQVTGTCKAFQDDMVKYVTTFLEPWFKTPNCATYQIAFKARNSSHNKRDEIIKSIAGTVQFMQSS